MEAPSLAHDQTKHDAIPEQTYVSEIKPSAPLDAHSTIVKENEPLSEDNLYQSEPAKDPLQVHEESKGSEALPKLEGHNEKADSQTG